MIVLMMMLIATAGIAFSVVSARQSVKKEVDASITSLVRMLDIELRELSTKADPEKYLSELIHQLEQQRHLSIRLQQENTSKSNQVITIHRRMIESTQVPRWFFTLVRPLPQNQSRVVELNNQRYTLILRDDPDDEIKEAWGEAQGLFYLLALQSLLVWVLCHFILGQALKPLPALLSGLQRIENADYTTRLSEFSLPEYKLIADAFNHAMSSLELKTAENRFLVQHSLNLQEREQQALARELHDELAQSLTGMKGIASSIQVSCPQSRQAVDAILSICDDLFSVVRSMMRRLRPSSLDELGLLASLQELVSDWQQKNPNCHISLDASIGQSVLSDEITIYVYRIVQESLNNISRHARATRASIMLRNTADDKLNLIISDNGVGFDHVQTSYGFGLLGMRERVENLNGSFDINSQPGQGVVLSMMIPVPA